MAQPQATGKEGWIVIFAIVGLIGLAYIAISFTDNGHNKFANSFWEKRAKYAGQRIRGVRDPRKTYDIVTPEGWHGTVDQEVGNDGLTMKINDFLGKPVKGLAVAAQISAPNSPAPRQYGILNQSKDGAYRSGKLKLKPGRWDVVLTARKPVNDYESDLLFRVEKQINVK